MIHMDSTRFPLLGGIHWVFLVRRSSGNAFVRGLEWSQEEQSKGLYSIRFVAARVSEISRDMYLRVCVKTSGVPRQRGFGDCSMSLRYCLRVQ